MAEASFQVYVLVIMISALFGYSLVILRNNRLHRMLPRRRFRITYSFVYGFFGFVLLITGFLFAYFGLLYMTFTEISIEYFDLPQPITTESENTWLVNSTFTILKDLKKQSLELKHSEGLALTGIGFGIMLVAIPMFLESWRHGRENHKTMLFLIADLNELNGKLVTVINLLQNTITDLHGNRNFIHNLVSRNVHPTLAFGTIVSGLYFHRWELYASYLREFGLDDPRTINQLHGYILEFNKTMELAENSIVSQVINILDSNNSNISNQLQIFLTVELSRNLNKYQNLHDLFHRELDKITWIPNRTWRQLT